MPSAPDSIGEGIMFSGCPSAISVRLFIWTDIVTMISREQLEQFDKTDREDSLAPTDHLMKV